MAGQGRQDLRQEVLGVEHVQGAIEGTPRDRDIVAGGAQLQIVPHAQIEDGDA